MLLGSRRPGERTDLPVSGLSETADHAEVLVNATFALLFMGIAGGLGADTFDIHMVTRPSARVSPPA